MKICPFFSVFAFIFSLFAPELLAQTGPEATLRDGKLVFLEGVTLSYASHHAEAQKDFAAYRKLHPDDLLVYLRMLYDRFFGVPDTKLSHDEYSSLLTLANEAIAKYETESCAGTDLRSITGDTLDCAYIGAALYSFRMALVGKNDSWYKVGKDKDEFVKCAKLSRSLQTQFLLGLYEYEPSVQLFGLRWLLKHVAHVPTDHAHAVITILRSLDGNVSPFVDDIWFFVFDAECRCDGGSYGDRADFTKKYPLEQVFRYLRAKYPSNIRIKKFDH